MFEIIAIIAVVLAIAIAIVLILAATKPNTLRVQRATTVRAPPEKIFPLINDFHQWGAWSPYEAQGSRDEAQLQRSPPRGKGAVYAGKATRMSAPAAWKSSMRRRRRKSSSSSISSRRSRATTPPSSQCCRRAMPPQRHVADAWTGVFMSKVMQVFINLDNMIGKDFEVGLANLKRLTEK